MFPSAVNTDTGVVDAYQHMAPMVDTVTYMQWLYKQCRDKGCRFVHDEIRGLLRDQAEDLKRKYKAQLIFNCSGLSAKELAGDEDVYPLRGKYRLGFRFIYKEVNSLYALYIVAYPKVES